jgi:hypothetical protein
MSRPEYSSVKLPFHTCSYNSTFVHRNSQTILHTNMTYIIALRGRYRRKLALPIPRLAMPEESVWQPPVETKRVTERQRDRETERQRGRQSHTAAPPARRRAAKSCPV